MRAKKYTPILLLGLLLLAQISHSQNVYHINDQSNLSTCSAIVHDDGGEYGEYGANQDHVLTITNPNGNQIRLDFTEFDLELYYDNFIIYDGANTSADVMYNYNWYGQENKSPGTIVSSSDKITVRIKSDSYNTDYEEGFTFSVSCYEPNCDQNFPAGNTCADAVQICSTQEYCGTTTSTYTANTPGNLSSLFCGSIENNSFLKFTAASDTAQFEALVYGCTGSNSYWLKGRRQGVQFQVLSTDDCNNFNDYGACFSPGVEQGGIFTARGLTAGEDYLIMVDGYAGDNCNYSIRAINGVELPVKAREDIITCNADSIRVGATFYPENSTNIIWTTSGDGTFSNNTSTDPYYYPGNADKSNGEVWIYVENNESIDPNCQQNATDSLLITITSVNVNLSPADLILCENETLTVSANTNSEISENYTLNFADNTLYSIPDDGVNYPWNGQVGNFLRIPLEVNCLNEHSWNLSEICINATHGRTSDLSGIYLVNPCGDLIQIANANNIINGCIAPGNNAEWQNFLSCSNPNGTWELRIADDRNNKTGSISNFALQFNGSNYAWLNASNQVIGTGLQTNISQTGNYSIVVNNCQSNCNQSVDFAVVGSSINYAITKQDISCFGNNNGKVVFNNNSGLEFSHNNGAYQNDTLYTNLSPGTHYFNIKNSDNCVVNDSIEILEPTKLTQDSIQNICTTPLPYNVNFSANGGTSPYTFIANNDTLSSNNYHVNNYGTVNYKVVDSKNCVDSNYFEIKESKNAGFSYDDPECGTLSTLIYLDEGCLADSFWVSNGSINLTDCGEYTLTANNYETITVKHIVQNGFCSDTATQEITFIAFPDPQFSVEELECGKLTTFLTVENPHANVSWDIFPLDGSVILPTLIPNKYLFTAIDFKSYQVKLNYDNNQCSKSNAETIVFDYELTPSITTSPEVCGLEAVLDVTNTGDNTPLWTSFFPGDIRIDNPISEQTTVTVSEYGTYLFYYIQESTPLCPIGVDTLSITFFEEPSAATVEDQEFCGLNSVHELTINPEIGFCVWNNLSDLNTTINNTYSISATQEGTTYHELLIKNGVCPENKDTFQITVFQEPEASITSDSMFVCGKQIQLNDFNVIGNQNWNSTSPAFFANFNGNINISNPDYGFNTFYLSAQNGSCLPKTDSIIVYFEEAPKAINFADTSICGTSLNLNIPQSTSFTLGEWSSNTLSINANQSEAMIEGASNQTHSLTWTEKAHKVCNDYTTNLNVSFFSPTNSHAGLDTAVCGLALTMPLTDAPLLSNKHLRNWIVSQDLNQEINGNEINYTATQANTYQVVRQDKNGVCPTSSDTAMVAFVAIPFGNAGVDQTVCGNETILNASSNADFHEWSVVNSPANATLIFSDKKDPNSNITSNGFGEFTLVWTERNFGDMDCECEFTDTVRVTFIEQPVLALSNIAYASCNDTIKIDLPNNLVGDLTWSPQAGLEVTNDNTEIVIVRLNDNQTNYTLDLQLNNQNTCYANDTVDLEFFTKPEISVQDSLINCGLVGEFNLTKTEGKLAWNNGNVNLTENNQKINFELAEYGSHNITFYLKNSVHCPIDSATISITAFEQPQLVLGDNQSICGKEVELTAQLNTGNIEWQALNQNISFSNINALTTAVNTNLFGEYNIMAIASNGTCPNDTATQKIFFVEQPTANAGADTSICSLSTVLNGNQNDFESYWKIIDQPANANSAITNPEQYNAQFSTDIPGIYTLEYSVKNGNVCEIARDTLTLSVLETPKAIAGNDIEVCGLSAQLNANTNNQNIEWKEINTSALSFTDINNPTTEVSASSAGTYLAELIATNNPQCGSSSDTISVKFVSEPIAIAGADTTTCDSEITLSVNDFGNQLSWKIISSPAGSVATIENSNSNKPSLTNATIGTYTLKLNASNELCASVSDEINIEFLAKPVAIAGNDIEVCGLSAQLNANSNNQNIEWKEINTSALNFTDINNPTTDVTATSAGTYLVELIATNNPQCGSSRDTVALTFISEPIAMAGADTATCDNEITLSVNDFGNQLSWEIFSSPTGSNATLENSGSNKPSLKNTKTGEYQLLLTASKNNCSSDTDTLTVRFLESASANAGEDLSICGNEIQLQAQPNQGNGAWRQEGGNNNISFQNPTLYNSIATSSVPGTFKLIWEENNGNSCPSAMDTMVVEFKAYPTVDAGTDTNICTNNINLNPTTTSHTNVTWSVLTANASNVEFKNQNNLNTPVTFNDADSYKLQLSVEKDGCTSTDSVNITLWNTYDAQAGNDTVICTNSIVLNSETLENAYATRWYANNASVVKTSANQFTANFPTAGVYTMYYEINNGQFCGNSTDSMLVTVNKSIDFELAPDTLICGDSYQLAVNNLPDGNWSISPQQNISIENDTLSLNNLASNTYTLYFEANQPEACASKTDSMLITVQNMPVLNIDAPDSLCENESFYFNINSSTQDPFTFSFTFGGDDEIYEIGADSLAINIPGFETSKQFVLANISSLNNPACISNQIINHHVHINKTPTANIFGGGEFCEGDSVEIFVEMEGEAPYSLELSNNSSFESNLPNFKTKIEANNSDTITIVTASDKYCKSNNNGEVKIKVNELPEVNILGDFQDSYCNGDSLQISLEGIKGKAQFTVSSNLGDIKLIDKKILNLSMNSTDSVIEFYTVRDLNNCTSEIDTSFSFTVNQLPTVNISSPKVVCTDSVAELNLEFNGQESFSLYYETNNYQIANNLLEESRIEFMVKEDLELTIHKISDANGCEQIIDSIITIEAIKAPVITLNTAQDSICQGDSALVFINVYGESDRYTTSLSINNETTDIILREKNERWISINDSTQISFNNIRGLNLPLCASPEYSLNLFAKDTTSIDFMISENQVCNPANIEFVPLAETLDTNAQYIWTDNYGWSSKEMFATRLADYAGVIAVSLSYTNDQGCTSTITKDTAITVYEKPYADFNYNPDIITVQENKLITDNLSEESYKSYAWILNDSLRSTEYDTEFYLNPEGADNELCLAVANENCVDTTCKTITVKDEVLFYIPNTFTPDGDGNNDTYEISAQGIDQLKFQVYNRFGHVVYETSNVNFSWDGVSDGEPCKQDTYQYLLTYKLKGRLKMKQLKGTIHLLR